MATVSLRKRTRSAFETDVSVSVPSKRRATRRAVIKTKENVISIFTPPEETTIAQEPKSESSQDGMDIDIKSSPLKPSSPSKKNVGSPVKVNDVYKSSKPAAFNIENAKKPTPSTPSKRDRIQVLPITPRHRILLPGSTKRTPKTPAGRIIDAFTPGTPVTPSSRTIFTTGKNLFVRSTAPGKLVGREKERETLTEFLKSKLDNKVGGCMYVSGPPGTGKSALLAEVIADLSTEGVKMVYINCMSAKDPKGIYSKLAEDFLGDESVLGTDVDALEKLFVPKKKSTANVSIINSKLVLVGIANALDLTDRFLPRLKARNFEPTLLPVLPYSAEQIAQVVTSKLKSLNDNTCEANWVPLIHPSAITLCSKKVAQSTGDLRKCFDICRKAIDMVEHETKTKMMQQMQQQEQSNASASGFENTPTKDMTDTPMIITPTTTPRKPLSETVVDTNAGTPTKMAGTRANPLQSLTALSAPRATLSHIARISTTSFGMTSNTRLKSLNINQKAVVCALVVLSRKTNGGGVLVKDLWQRYLELCKSDSVLFPTVTKMEFFDILSGLEAAGVAEMVGGTTGGSAGLGRLTPSKRGRGKGGMGGKEERMIRATVKEEEVKAVVGADGGQILLKMFSEV
ncbi:hypothetical protein ABW20_dc0107516 [Dactylellina cionopaga]|nr:hypothetical protein ABW20_dc0107516 [Dactylellina cionopaga]